MIQHLLESGKPEQRSAIIAHVLGNVLPFCLHKFASNVVERCLEFGSTSEKTAIVEEILAPTIAALRASPYGVLPDDALQQPLTPVQILVKDQFGNYVVQRCMDAGNDTQRAQLVEVLRQCVPMMRRYAFGKHILMRLEKISSKGLLVPAAAAASAAATAGTASVSSASPPASTAPTTATVAPPDTWNASSDLTSPPGLGLGLPLEGSTQ